MTQHFDAQGNVDEIADGTTSYLSGATYTASHLLTGATFGNGTTLTKTYDRQQKLQSLIAQNAQRKVLQSGYEYNSFGSLTGVTDGLNAEETLSYKYDGLNRILDASSKDGSLKQHFAYDAFGNRALATDAQAAPAFDEHNRLTGAAGVTYDELGQVTSDGEHTYTFTAGGLIATVDGGAIKYFYDGDGNRVQKVVEGRAEDYIWYGEQLLAERLANGTWVDYIYANGQRIAGISTPAKAEDGKPVVPKTTYFVTDTLGVTRVALSGSGKVTAAGLFAPFETEVREKSGSTAGDTSGSRPAVNLTYTGELHDAETGLETYKYRSYNPRLGRWMSPDPSSLHYSKLSNPQTFNLYAYVDNDPLKYRDQLGLYGDDGDCDQCLYDDPGGGEAPLQDGGSPGNNDGGGGGGGDGGDPCAYDPSCVTVIAPPDPPVDVDPPPSSDPCTVDACVTTDPDPPINTDPPPNSCYLTGCSLGLIPSPDPFVPVSGSWIYGNWCGKGGEGPTKDSIDNACMIHDLCYQAAKVDGSSIDNDSSFNALSGIQQNQVQVCDQQLCASADQLGPSFPIMSPPRRAAFQILEYFTYFVPKGARCK